MNWEDKIKAFLHDPPDKALRISDHEERRDRLLQVLGLKFDVSREFDWVASSLERVVPKSNLWIDFSRADKTMHPVLRHPITGRERGFEVLSQAVLGLKKTRVEAIIEQSVKMEIEILKSLKTDDPKATYFRIWRFFGDLIAQKNEELANLPADTRCPDHTIWDHLDASSAVYGAISRGKAALMMFKLAPVQNFIKNARKEADLWAGSHLLSYLTFQAMKVVVNEFGPDAIIFPHLRGQPFFDKEFEEYFAEILVERVEEQKLSIANIPNKFLAIVSADEVKSVEGKIREEINKTLEDLLKFSLESSLGGKIDEQVGSYLKQLQNYFSVTVCANPADPNELLRIVEKLPEHMREKYEKWLSLLESRIRDLDLYPLMFELLEEIVAVESRKFNKLEGFEKEKCTLCGELEVVGDKEMWDWKIFKKNERLCPVCLIKRMYPKWMEKRWKIKVGFESVSEVALKRKLKDESTYYDIIHSMEVARKLGCEKAVNSFYENINRILDRLGLSLNLEVVYKENLSSVRAISRTLGVDEKEIKKIPNVEKHLEKARNAVIEIEKVTGEFPKYYAILMMDGDDMGRMLIGDEMRPVMDYLHPKVLEHLPHEMSEKTKRLITPATHSAISRALAHFSVNVVPDIVKKYRGELIYAGGDDVLALLPTDSALACAYEIQRLFGEEWDGWNVMPAKTMSAGILIVHYKHPLYDALDKVRELERKAKEFGRNAVAIGYLARSGSYDEVVVSWEVLRKLNAKVGEHSMLDLIKRSKEREREPPYISERLSYDVARKIDNLPNIEAIKHFLKYELSRHYHGRDEREKKEEIGKLASKLIGCAKHVRVTLSKNELEEVLGCKLRKSDVRRVNDLIKCLIRNGKLDENGLRYGCEELEGVGELKITDGYEGLEALILKKQIRGLFTLLKILIDCDADLGCWP